jgi:bacterioferritin-associated ferredoxin
MYVCMCHALTEGDVRSAEADGAAKHDEVFRHYGVKVQCGRCVPTMRGLLGSTEQAGDRRHLPEPQAATRTRTKR